MGNISSVTSAYASVGRATNGATPHTIKPVEARVPAAPIVEQYQRGEEAVLNERQAKKRQAQEERRKVARRLSHQPVLVELRSGVERRHFNRREDDLIEHIDEEV